jgi:hypothetical protein
VGTASGDFLLAVMVEYGPTQFGVWSPPAGWSFLTETAQGPMKVLAWTSTVDAGPGLTFGFANGSGSIQGALVAVRGGSLGSALITSVLTGGFTFALPGGSPQFVVVQNYDGLPHGSKPANAEDLVTETGIMGVLSVTSGNTSATWVGFNESDTVPAQALAFSGL